MAEVFWRKRGIGRWCSEGPQALAGWGYAGCLGRVILGCGAAMQDLGYELPRISIPRTRVNSPILVRGALIDGIMAASQR